MTDSVHICRRCGGALHPDETQGQCPACLLETILRVEEEPGPAESLDTPWLERDQLTGEAQSGRQAHRLGDYELLEEIGRGGMGVIYRARQVSLDRFVAVKMILTGPLASRDFVQRFHTEAHAAAVLEHPNIVSIYEVGNQEGQPFYSMRLVTGRNLAQELKETGAMPPRRSAELVATVAHAVHYAHQRGILHRDLKPANILLDAEDHPHVTDFGLAKLLEQDDGLTLTQAALGTPNYMAPEQAEGDASALTTAADVYSLGAILFEVLTGKKLFSGSTPLTTITRAREQEPPKPSAILPGIPRDLDTICWKCLEKDPRRRYASALALAEDLEHWLKGEPIQARRVGRVERVVLWCRRKPAMAGMAGAGLLAVLLISGIATWRLMVARGQKQLEEYARTITLADAYIRDGATDRALELLLQCPKQLRQWEWGRLVYMCHQDIASIPAHTNVARWLSASLMQGLAINADGTRVLTKGTDAQLKLWEPLKPELLRAIGDTNNEVMAWTFSPDGKQVALGFADGGLQVIDAVKGVPAWTVIGSTNGGGAPGGEKGRTHRRIVGVDFDTRENRPFYEPFSRQPESVATLGYSPEGRYLAVGTGNQEIVIRDAATGTEHTRWQHHVPEFNASWYTPDGSLLVARGKLAYELIDSKSGQPKATNVWSEQQVATLAVDLTGSNAVTIAYDGKVCLWKCGRKTFQLLQFESNTGYRNAFFDPQGRWVCITGKATKAGVYEVATGQLVLSVAHEVNGGTFSKSADRLITFGADRLIRLWDLALPMELKVLPGHLSLPESSAFSSDGQLFATASRDGIVKLWTGWPGRELVQTDNLGMIGPYSPDGRLWATSLSMVGIYVCESDSGKVVADFPFGKTFCVLAMAFSPDGTFLVSVGGEKHARIWDVRQQRLSGLLRGAGHAMSTVWWSRDGRWIATGDMGGVARIWDASRLSEWKTIKAHESSIWTLQIDPTGTQLLTSGYGPSKLWNIQTGKLIRNLDDEDGGSPDAVFSPDGRRIASPGVDRQIRVWDAANGELIARWPGRAQCLSFCGFSPDSRRFVVPVTDHGVYQFASPFLEIWDAEHGRHLLDLRGHTDCISGSFFSPRGDRIVTASTDQTVRHWEAFPWREADYSSFPGATFPKRLQSYCRAYWRDRIAAERTTGSEWPPKPLGSGSGPTPREWESLVRPVRAAGTSSNLLNLDNVYTGALDCVFRNESSSMEADDDLSQLPTGVVAFEGIEFDIRGVVMLRIGPPSLDKGWANYPVRTDGIQVGQKLRRLHVLHAAVEQAPPSTVIGSYVLHYADGSQAELGIVYGHDLRTWWLGGRGDTEKEVSAATVAWTGTNPLAEACEAMVRIFHRVYENPRPDLKVVSIDFVSKLAPAAPFLVAMTVEP